MSVSAGGVYVDVGATYVEVSAGGVYESAVEV